MGQVPHDIAIAVLRRNGDREHPPLAPTAVALIPHGREGRWLHTVELRRLHEIVRSKRNLDDFPRIPIHVAEREREGAIQVLVPTVEIGGNDPSLGRKLPVEPFLQNVLESGSHWLARPIVPNQLAPGVELAQSAASSE